MIRTIARSMNNGINIKILIGMKIGVDYSTTTHPARRYVSPPPRALVGMLSVSRDINFKLKRCQMLE